MKKMLALILTLVTCVSLLPAYASEEPAEDAALIPAEAAEEAPVPAGSTADAVWYLAADGISSTPAHEASWYTEDQVYARLMAMKAEYPEGRRWTNDNTYSGTYEWYDKDYDGVTMTFTGGGCAGFALLMSDAAFGSELPIWHVYSFTFGDVRVGDTLRLQGDSHSVIVLEVRSDSVVIAEGNYNSSIHWGRVLSRSEVESSDYIVTRWPGVPGGSGPVVTPEPTESPEPTETPEPPAGSVEISAANFPDENFRGYISNYHDMDSDGWLSPEEIADSYELDCYSEGIRSLQGIALFTEMVILDCRDNDLTELDLTGCTKLAWLYCDSNPLERLDVSPCPHLCATVADGRIDDDTTGVLAYWRYDEEDDQDYWGISVDEGVEVIANGTAAPIPTPKPFAEAPLGDWSLQTIDGRTINQDTYADKTVLFVFYRASLSGGEAVCMNSSGTISSLAESALTDRDDLQIIAVDVDGNSAADVAAFKSAYAPDCGNIVFAVDDGSLLWQTMDALGKGGSVTLAVCAVVQNGVIRDFWTGNYSEAACRQHLEKFLSDTPAPAELMPCDAAQALRWSVGLLSAMPDADADGDGDADPADAAAILAGSGGGQQTPEPTEPPAPVTDTPPARSEAVSMDSVLALLDVYAPDGAWILRNSDCDEDTLSIWMGGSKTVGERSAQGGLETTVHEQCHDYTNYGWREERIYTGNGTHITVPFTAVYDSREMISMIPESLRTSRFSTYVDTDEQYMASRQDGAYGLLNEFTAYYWGCDTYVRLHDYYRDVAWGGTNGYVSYAEFRYYILTYMLYAKDNYPDVYSGILANDAFREAFSFIDDSFGGLVAQWRASGTMPMYYDDEFDPLMNEMKKPEYTEMAAKLRP